MKVGCGENKKWLLFKQTGHRTCRRRGVQLREVPPHPQTNANGKIDIVSGQQAIIQNVYTEPERRRRGLAALLIKRIIDWTRQEGIDSLVLHANDSALSPRPKCDLTASDNRQSGSD